MNITLNKKYLNTFVSENEIESLKEKTLGALSTLTSKTGEGNDFLGWINYFENLDKEEYNLIKESAKKINSDSEVLIVIGIGGSYLGAKAIIEALSGYFNKKNKLEIIFAGNCLSSTYTSSLLDYVKDKDFSVNVISKSGTTTEPAVAFRLFKSLLEEKYGKDEAAKRIYATTDAKKGALRTLSNSLGYTTFVVPDDIGGRYSWITAVGLLPVACANIDIDMLMKGAKDARDEAFNTPFEDNACLQYAAIRNHLMNKGLSTEILVSYEPCLLYIAEWWKQLFGESEGKNHTGLFPASLIYSTDLHSMGQYVQEGKRIMFETVLNIEKPVEDITLDKEEVDLDQLNYLAGKSLDYVSKQALEGTCLAHTDGQVPNIVLNIKKIDEYNLGYLLYFFMVSCGVTSYLSGVNPFNQPGVEAYKKNMFALLEKPGYEELTKQLKK